MALYSLERCERSGRWAAESRAMARRLAKLPAIRAALASGAISWSMAEVISRRASPESEEAILEDAKTATVRAMRTRLPAKASDPDPEEDPPMRTLTVTMSASDAWALECTRQLVQAIEGNRSDESVVYALLAEGETTMLDVTKRSLDLDSSPARQEAKRAAEYRAESVAWQREAEEMTEDSLDLEVEVADPIPDAPIPTDPIELDGAIRALATDLAAKDAVVGDLARRIFDANGWRRLGYATEQQYAHERVGCSLASLRGRMTLSRRGKQLPAVLDALAAKTIGYEHAALVARVATPSTVDAWIARAKERTTRFLREEVEAVEMMARVSGHPEILDHGPPDAETLEATKALRRSVLTGDAFEGKLPDFQMSVGPEPEEEEGTRSLPKVRPGAGRVTQRFRLAEDTYWHWKALEAAFRRSPLRGSFVAFLCRAFWEAWKHLAVRGKDYEVLLRDLFLCSNPVCGATGVEEHHIVFRSQGGSDEAHNRTCLCGRCHRHGVHEGRLKATPTAPEITWTIGETPILKVEGRRRILLS